MNPFVNLNKRAFMAIGLLLITGCGEQRRAPRSAADSAKAEIEVIVSLLREQYGFDLARGTPLVIRDTLSAPFLRRFQSHDEFARLFATDDLPPVSADVIRDFYEKNTKPQPVWPQLGSHVNVSLLSPAEEGSIFSVPANQQPDGWRNFSAKYPNSPDIITLSRVGISRRGDRALLYFSSQCRWKDGGALYLLRKRNGKWEEETRIGEWKRVAIMIGPSLGEA